MKLRCIKDTYQETKGFFNKETITVKRKGITSGKSYYVQAVTEVSGDGNIGFGSIESGVKFLVYNDDGQWKLYGTNWFAPEAE